MQIFLQEPALCSHQITVGNADYRNYHHKPVNISLNGGHARGVCDERMKTQNLTFSDKVSSNRE